MTSPLDMRAWNVQNITRTLREAGMDPEAIEEGLQAIRDTHAHRLAHQQRNWDAEAAGYTDPQMAVYAAADLVDPDVDQTGEEGTP
jgi:hypothetical protein